MALENGGNAPYAPPATVLEMITRYRDRGMTTPINVEVLERAGIPESLTRRTLQALKLLEILDGDGNPTSAFEQATRSGDEEFREKLRDMLTTAYGDVFSFADPAKDSYDRVRDAFRGFNPRGQQDRMVTLFLGLMEFVGVDVRAAAGSRTREVAPPSGRSAKKAPTTAVRKGAKDDPGTGAGTARTQTVHPVGIGPAADDLPPGLVGLLHQIPRGGAGWPAAQRDAFLAAFTAVLNFTIPVREHEPAPSPVVSDDEEDET
jgi:hypothetical protein